MNKILLGFMLTVLSLSQAIAQSAKTHPPVKGPAATPEQLKFRPWPGKPAVPPAANPFGLPRANFQPMGPLVLPPAAPEPVQTLRGENGLPIFFQGQTEASAAADADKPAGARALEYLASLQPSGLRNPLNEFKVKSAEADEQGNIHVRLEQVFAGIPVYGGEVVAHTQNGVFSLLNGRYFPTPALTGTTPAVSAQTALEHVRATVDPAQLKSDWTPEELALIGGAESHAELVIYHPNGDLHAERLAWHLTFYPNMLRRTVYFVDAQTGAIIQHYDHTCAISPKSPEENPHTPATVLDGPVPASGLDLKNQNRSFGAWLAGGTYFMEDAGRPMFNSAKSQMPSAPVGAIVTLDAFNTSPEIPANFKYDLVYSGSAVFSNKTAVSAHWNAIQSYEYYRTKHNRNSIDNVGGNILSFINIANANGTPMDNAYWNGNFMSYGNGNTDFTPLAGGLDVGGHEMTHGVIENTANLEYQDESGALNESFADVFAVCIDADDWKIGEDVVKPGTTTNGCLRDMSDPTKGDPAQPKHVNQKYTGAQDNGGVHINSGIPNHAFYLFASNAAVGRDKAEKVYYKALRDYLVKSSQFIDCRLAVIQAATDLYGSAVANIAADAFTAVGIVGNQGGNYLGQLAVNPGVDLIACSTNTGQNLDLAAADGTILGTIYNKGVASKPSVTDNGAQMVFVNTAGHIIGVDLVYSNGNINYQTSELSISPIWRSAAISKDGRFLAALEKTQNNRIYIIDLGDQFLTSETFFLYNPTYSQTPQITGEVDHADVLEFDYSGEYLMYDAYNSLNNGQGEDLSYWDIGFLKFWENGAFVDGGKAFISKLFSGLPEGASVGNPTFSKNSPYVIAFDYNDGLYDRYDVLGANIETGDLGYLVPDNGELGWPSYTRLDDAILFQRGYDNGTSLLVRALAPDKIQGQGNLGLLVLNRDWGTWFANGNRSLMVSTAEADADRLRLSAAPNPATDAVRLSFTAPRSGPAQVLVSDMLGRAVLTQQWSAVEGTNQFDLNMAGLPAGTYAVRLLAGNTGATLKIVKQ